MKFTTYEKSGAKHGEIWWVTLKGEHKAQIAKIIIVNENVFLHFYYWTDYKPIDNYLFGDVIPEPDSVEIENE